MNVLQLVGFLLTGWVLCLVNRLGVFVRVGSQFGRLVTVFVVTVWAWVILQLGSVSLKCCYSCGCFV